MTGTKNHENAIILDEGARALAHYPHARRVGNLLFVSGLSSRRPDNSHEGVTIHPTGVIEKDVRIQTRACLQNLRTILQQAGGDLHNVVDITTFLVDMKDFPGYNEIYNQHFEAQTGPTRTTVAVHQLPHPNLLIEIKAIAAFA